MKRLRYFTETLQANADPHHETQKSAIHENARSYHWVRLDSNTIFGYVELDEHHFSNLVNGHPTVSLHPSIHEKITMKDHLSKHKKDEHFTSLQNFAGVAANDTTIDVIAKMVGKGHICFSLDK